MEIWWNMNMDWFAIFSHYSHPLPRPSVCIHKSVYQHGLNAGDKPLIGNSCLTQIMSWPFRYLKYICCPQIDAVTCVCVLSFALMRLSTKPTTAYLKPTPKGDGQQTPPTRRGAHCGHPKSSYAKPGHPTAGKPKPHRGWQPYVGAVRVAGESHESLEPGQSAGCRVQRSHGPQETRAARCPRWARVAQVAGIAQVAQVAGVAQGVA